MYLPNILFLAHHPALCGNCLYIAMSLICLYKRQSSANKLQEDLTQLGKSLMYIKSKEQYLEDYR